MTLNTPRTLLAAAAVASAAVLAAPAAASPVSPEQWAMDRTERLGSDLTAKAEQTLSVGTFRDMLRDALTRRLNDLLADTLRLGQPDRAG